MFTRTEPLLDLQHVINMLKCFKVVETKHSIDFTRSFSPLIELKFVKIIVLIDQLLFLKTVDGALVRCSVLVSHVAEIVVAYGILDSVLVIFAHVSEELHLDLTLFPLLLQCWVVFPL